MRRTKNAFSEEFLARVDMLDEIGSSLEAELAGPWKVLAIEEGFGLYEPWQDAEASHRRVHGQGDGAEVFGGSLRGRPGAAVLSGARP